MRCDDGVFRFEKMCHQHHSGHTRIGHHSAMSTLKPGDGFCQHITGRVTATGVVVLALAAKTFETEVGRQIYRRHHRTMLPVSINARTNRIGNFLEFHDDRLVSMFKVYCKPHWKLRRSR